MIRIKLHDHPFAPTLPQVIEAESLAMWLLDHYGAAPSVRVQIFAGEPSAETEIVTPEQILAAVDGDYTILQSPAGLELAWYTWVAIAAIAAVALVALIPKPVMPGNINRTQSSPNNALGNRENKVRILERIEDIFGTVKSIPSLLMPTYIKYISSRQYEYGYYCVGRGYYDLAELRDGETLLADIPGASALVYAPFTSPNSGHAPQLQIGDAIIDDVLTTSRAIEVDGITLKALNQVQLPESAVYSFARTAGGGGTITQAAKNPNINAVAAALDEIVVVMEDYVTYSGGEPDGSGGTTPLSETSRSNYSGTYVVESVADGVITLTSVNWTSDSSGVQSSVQIVGASDWTAWATLPAPDRTEVWCNILATGGMFRDKGGKSTTSVSLEIQIEQLDVSELTPTGNVTVVAASLSGAVSDERADTIEHVTAWVGPARVRMRRSSQYDYGFEGTIVDEVKWADLYSVSPVDKTEFGNKTTIHTITQATARATAVKTRQLNCIASRRLPIYNGSTFSGAFDDTGRLVSGTIAATSSIVDIIAAVSVDPRIGARDLATEVDMPQIWSVQQLLDAWNPNCGQFNYTFDSDNTSFEETLISIANAGFCIAYRQAGKVRLAFDRPQENSTALFTHRNKKPMSETITRKFASDSEYDGVEFVYVDPDSDQSETITLPLDGSYTKLKKFEIAGIRSFSQAWLRANREYQKLIGQRITIETTTTLDARSLLPNSRIDVVDNTRFQSYDGEVVAQDGLVLTLSQDVVFSDNLPHSIVLMRRDGSLQGIPATAGDAPNKIVLQSAPAEAITTQYGENGIRTIYSFAADSARGSMAYLVQELDISDGQYVTIRGINYSDQYFAADYQAIPAKALIIN
jgi:hypothetical protein